MRLSDYDAGSMEVEVKSKKRARSAKAKPVYQKGPIPYGVSQPKRFWKIPKGLPPDVYWKKRYWRRRITGKGDYVMDPGASFGTRWGGYLGAKAGEWLGGGAQTLLTGALMGLGDYKVKRNVFLSGRLPQVVNNPAGGGTIIRFQEYLGDIYTSASANTFQHQEYLINAANPITFPFLSQIAANYEQYSFEGMVFEFRSTSGDALDSVNTALGSVMMATQYDVQDPVFTSKMEMLNYEFSSSTKPSRNLAHMIECEPSQTTVEELYTLYNQDPPANSDPRLYHLGRFCIATTGFQGTSVNVGELHVTYQVRLLKPKLFVSLGSTTGYYVALMTGLGVYDDNHPIGTSAAQDAAEISTNIPITFSGNTLVLPATSAKLAYRIQFTWYGDTATVVYVAPSTPALLQNCIVTRTDATPANGDSTLSASLEFGITTLGTGKPVLFALPTTGTLPTAVVQQILIIRVIQVPPESGGL